MQQGVILREGGKNVQEKSKKNATGNKKTWSGSVSMVHVFLQYIASFWSFEKNMNPITFFKYDNYKCSNAYRLAVALCRVIYVKVGVKIECAEVKDDRNGTIWKDEERI